MSIRARAALPSTAMAAAEDELTIEELSERVGVTARNIRAYQTQGLLPLPERRGRVGIYGPGHVTRLEMIRDLREQGIGLAAIERLTRWGEGISPDELRATAGSMLQGLIEEEPAIVPATDATDMWGDEITPELLERSQATGFFEMRDDGTFVVHSPTLRAHGRELKEMGVSFEQAIETMESLREHLDAIAATFTELFLSRMSAPELDGTETAEERAAALREIAGEVERAKPMATTAVNAAFRLVLQQHLERALEEVLAERRPPEADELAP